MDEMQLWLSLQTAQQSRVQSYNILRHREIIGTVEEAVLKYGT
jgi:hypothetical protein